MGQKLRLKGDPTPKKRKHKSSSGPIASSSKSKNDGQEPVRDPMEPLYLDSRTQQEGWIDLPSPTHASGPLYILHAQTEEQPATCMAINTTLNNTIYPHVFLDPQDPALQEPADIHHVFVCTMLPDSDTKCTLRSMNGRFLAFDATGGVGVPTEARGPQEELEFIAHPSVPGAFALRSCMHGKFLSIDEVAGGKLEYRGDAETLGMDEAFRIKMQAKFENDNERKRQTERPSSMTRPLDGLTIIKDVKGAEDETIRHFHTRGSGRLVSSAEDVKDLKRARKEGKLNETMLDRRMKLKHDRYC